MTGEALRVGLLGALTVEASGRTPVTLASPKQRRLLSILALEPGRVVSADRLCDLLECSAGSLRTTISRLRASIGSDHVQTSPPGYTLVADTDLHDFEAAVREADAADDVSDADRYLRALQLWRGSPIEEFRDESWAIPVVARVEELRSVATELRSEALLGDGAADLAIIELRDHIAWHPLRERPHAILMRALDAEGRVAEALRVFHDFRQHLVDETGTEPSPSLRALEQAIAVGLPEARPTGAGDGRLVFLLVAPDESLPLSGDDPATVADLAQFATIVDTVALEHQGMPVPVAIGGRVVAFDSATEAAEAARDAQTAVAKYSWKTIPAPGYRMGIHSGIADRRDDQWHGPVLEDLHEMTALGHPGQVLASERVAAALDVALTDLGEHQVPGREGSHRFFQVDAGGVVNRFPPLRSLGSHPSTLPAQRTTLIGREDLVARVGGLVGEHRLVTLVGPGGVGKTRLAIAAASWSLRECPGGAYFADLTRTTTGDDVAGEVLRATRADVRPGETDEDAALRFFRERRALLVVDNCEHVIDRAAEMIDNLLVAAPALRVLATSREALRLHGERRLIVPSLGVDGPSSAGVRLFADRARAVDEADVSTSIEVDTVEQIVRHLDGIPLAIELAAAQSGSLSAGEILEHLGDRFTLLAQRVRRVPPRQQTLSAAIAWSYDLLADDQQRAFRLLGACAGAFSQATASGVLGTAGSDTAKVLDQLVGKSLLVTVQAGSVSSGFAMLETIREYAREQAEASGESVGAQRALERALLPAPELVDDWSDLVNRYLCAADPSMLLEDVTRVAAASRAVERGRLDDAALIFSSVAYRGDRSALQARAALVRPLVLRRAALSEQAWLAAAASKLLLERNARDYNGVLETAAGVLEELEPEHPARGWFDLWRCALVTAVDPATGIAEVELILDAVRAYAMPPLDWTLSQVLAVKATGLAVLRHLDQAADLAAEAASWAPVGQESRDQALALRVWISYLRGEPLAADLAVDVAGQPHGLGLDELCAAPGALAGTGSWADRAADVVSVARRRPALDVATPYLLAFAWLAIEAGELAQARDLVDHAEMFDSSTQIALLYALAAIEDWSEDSWDDGFAAMVGRYLSEEQEGIAKAGGQVLDAQVARLETSLAVAPQAEPGAGP